MVGWFADTGWTILGGGGGGGGGGGKIEGGGGGEKPTQIGIKNKHMLQSPPAPRLSRGSSRVWLPIICSRFQVKEVGFGSVLVKTDLHPTKSFGALSVYAKAAGARSECILKRLRRTLSVWFSSCSANSVYVKAAAAHTQHMLQGLQRTFSMI